MTRHVPVLIRLMLVSVVVALAGCQKPNQEPLSDQDAASAADRIKELQRQLDEAERARAAAEDEALALRTERDRLKDQLAGARGSGGDNWVAVPGGSMTSIEGTVLFDSGKAVLKPGGKSTLDAVAKAIRERFPDREIYIFGHTDAEPIRVSGWKDNYELSCQRALSVLRYLKGKGVTEYMAACGWGEHRPVGDNKSASGRQANRRVEIYAMNPRPPIGGSASANKP